MHDDLPALPPRRRVATQSAPHGHVPHGSASRREAPSAASPTPRAPFAAGEWRVVWSRTRA